MSGYFSEQYSLKRLEQEYLKYAGIKSEEIIHAEQQRDFPTRQNIRNNEDYTLDHARFYAGGLAARVGGQVQTGFYEVLLKEIKTTIDKIYNSHGSEGVRELICPSLVNDVPDHSLLACLDTARVMTNAYADRCRQKSWEQIEAECDSMRSRFVIFSPTSQIREYTEACYEYAMRYIFRREFYIRLGEILTLLEKDVRKIVRELS